MIDTKRGMLTMLAIGALVATPAVADAIAGCAIPLWPEPDEWTERSWDARGLVMFLEENGELELRGEPGQVLEVQAVFTLTGSGGRERLASGKGDPVKLEVGKYPIARAGDDIFEDMLEALFNAENVRSQVKKQDYLRVLSVQTLKHDQSPRYPTLPRYLALTLEYVNPSGRGAPANSHKLAVVLEVIGETEKNLR